MRALVCVVALAACTDVDLPLPIDGQHYICVATNIDTGDELGTTDRCGPWSDWKSVSDAVAREFNDLGYDNVHAECRGTGRACNVDRD